MVDVYPRPMEGHRIPFRPDWINRFLGTDIPVEDMLSYLAPLELVYDKETNEIVTPSWRQDLEQEADIAEEIARFFGYDKIPTSLPKGEATTGKLSFKHRIENTARDVAEFSGFSQAMTYSFESPKVFDKLLIPADSVLRQAITIANPLGEDFSIMRTLPLNGILTSLATNYNRRNKNVALYEIGNIYLPKALPLTELPDERTQFTLGFYGDGDFFTMKGVVEEYFYQIGMRERVHYEAKCDHPMLHPGRRADILYAGKCVGYLGEVHPQVLDNYGIGQKAYVAVIDIPSLLETATYDRKYNGIARFPAVSRDLSMLVAHEIPASAIEDVIVQRGGKLLEGYELFDIYEGAPVPPGFKSMAYSLTFRAADHTLEEQEITTVMKKILNGLDRLGIELRK